MPEIKQECLRQDKRLLHYLCQIQGAILNTKYVTRTSRYPADIAIPLRNFDKKMVKVNKKRDWPFVIYVNLARI